MSRNYTLTTRLKVLWDTWGTSPNAEYLVKWPRYAEQENTWEKIDDIDPVMIKEYTVLHLEGRMKLRLPTLDGQPPPRG